MPINGWKGFGSNIQAYFTIGMLDIRIKR